MRGAKEIEEQNNTSLRKPEELYKIGINNSSKNGRDFMEHKKDNEKASCMNVSQIQLKWPLKT